MKLIATEIAHKHVTNNNISLRDFILLVLNIEVFQIKFS